ncbi:hypothetical protein [Sphingomonas sp. RIT328]|uniref:hypothetical protein n=1 Tax=Sphingomonas sp. RIT328 TaxID=1470591 RepID=UPI00044A8F38|nr:hypothetical protein [Sphingomonas sp. RIT328]EZP49959.1 putative membrane protein [Sphingomonas sp. RIT328]
MDIRLSLVALLLRFWLPLLATLLYAARRGGPPERAAGGMLLAAAVGTLVVRTDFAHRYSSVQGSVVLIDVLLLVGLVALALKADRRWPILLAALHGMTVLGHVGKALNPNLLRLGYAVMISMPALPGLAVLAVGTWRHQLRMRRHGTDPSWSD